MWSGTFHSDFAATVFCSSTSSVSFLLVSRRCWRARGPPAPEADTSCGWSWEMSFWAWRSSNRRYDDTLPSPRAPCQVTVSSNTLHVWEEECWRGIVFLLNSLGIWCTDWIHTQSNYEHYRLGSESESIMKGLNIYSVLRFNFLALMYFALSQCLLV